MGDGPCIDLVVWDMDDLSGTSGSILKAVAFSFIIRLFRRTYHRRARPIHAKNTSPPTTPPAIAPTLDCDFLEIAEADGVDIDEEVDEEADEEIDEEVETLVLVVVTDEDIETGVLLMFC